MTTDKALAIATLVDATRAPVPVLDALDAIALLLHSSPLLRWYEAEHLRLSNENAALGTRLDQALNRCVCDAFSA